MRRLLIFGATSAFLAAGAVESAHAANRSAYVEGELSVIPSDHHVARGGDIVVHARRSYLDPGTSADVGSENRYFYDTAHFDMNSEGPDFTRNQGGFENLPGPLGN
jgi:hypothetical protein